MIKALERVAVALLSLVATAVGALVLAYFVVGIVLHWAPLKGPIESWAGDALGRPVAIRGAVDLHLLSPRPRLSVWDVAVANADWGSEPRMFEARRLTAEVDALELLRGGTGLRRLHLLEPHLLLERSADGRGNWDTGGPDEGPPTIPEIPSLTVQDGAITYRDPTTLTGGDLTVTELEAATTLAAAAPVRLTATGRLQGEPLDLRLEGGSLADLNAGGTESYPLDLALRAGESSITVAGTAVRPLEPEGLDLALAAESPDASIARSILDLPAGVDSYRLNGRVSWDGESWTVSDLDARLGASDLRGFARYGEDGERQVIEANLTSDRLNLDQLQAVADAVSGPDDGEPATSTEEQKGEEPAADALTPDRLLARLDELRTVDADIALAIGAIESRDLPIRAAEARVRLRDGALAVEPLRVMTADGQGLAGSLSVDASRDPVPVQAELSVGETAASVSGAIGRRPDAGPLGLDISLRSPDPSVLTSLVGLPSDLPGVAFEGRLRQEGAAWALRDFRAEVGESDLSGSIRLDDSGDRPSIAGTLTSTRLDVDQLREVAAEIRRLTGAAEETPPPDAEPADDATGVREFVASTAEALRAVNADLRLAVETIEGEDLPVRGLAGHVRLNGGVLAAEEVRLDLPEGGTITGSIRADARDEAEIPLSIQANLDDSSLQVEGTLTETTDLDAFELTLDGEGRNLATLNAALRPFVDGWSLPETPPYRVAGTLTHDGGAWEFDDFELAMGASDLIGTLRYEGRGEQRPLVTGSLTSSMLDLPEVLVVAGLRATPEDEVEEEEAAGEFVEEAAQADDEEGRGGWVLPDASLQLPFLNEFDAEIDYRSDEVRGAGNLPVRELAVRLRLAGGTLTVDPLEVEVGGGRLNATLALDAGADPTGLDLDARIRGFDAQHLLALLGEEVEEVTEGGSLSGRVVLNGRGGTLRDALRSAAGDVAVVMEGGRLSALVIEAFGFDLGEALAVWFADRDEEKDKVGVRCLVADFDLEGGVLKTETLVLDTTDTKVVGRGTIDLAAERLDLRLEPHAKDMSVLTAQTPINLQGTFGNVEVNPEREGLVARGAAAIGLGVLIPVVGAVLPFIEPGLAEDSDCRGLIEEAGERPAGDGGGGPGTGPDR